MSDSKSHDGSVGEKGSDVQDNVQEMNGSEFNLLEYHEHNAGRLVVDPEYVYADYATVAYVFVFTHLFAERLASSLAKQSPVN